MAISTCLGIGLLLAGAAEPPRYVRQATWQESMLASRAAMQRAPGPEREVEPFVSPVMRGRDPARRVRVRVTGWRELWLVATGVPNNGHGYSDWGEATLVARDGRKARLCELKPKSFWRSYGHLKLNQGHSGGPLQVGERRFAHGLGVHADSRICYRLDGKYEWLEAWIGIDIAKGARGLGHVRFEVRDRLDAGRADLGELWQRLEHDFPAARREMRWERGDAIWDADWPNWPALAGRYAAACRRTKPLAAEAEKLALDANDEAGLSRVRALYLRSRRAAELVGRVRTVDFPALRLAIADLTATFGMRYPEGAGYLARLRPIEKGRDGLLAGLAAGDATAAERAEELLALRREALLANPLLGFGRLLVVRRRPIKGGKPVDPDRSFGWDMGLPRSSHGNSSLPRNSHDNAIAVLSPLSPDGKLTILHGPEGHRFVGDVDLHFGAERLLFSMRDGRGCFQIFEMSTSGAGLRQLTRSPKGDVDNYDACYLPDGGIAFCSTACFQCVPCNGSHVAVLYRMDGDPSTTLRAGGGSVRQLCFEQDHDFNPAVLPSGRVLYLRWEYSDLPHANSRILFSMNPDGTGQMAVYGRNSYWPNSLFGARPIPGAPGKVVGIVAGHHGSHREGELVLFDSKRARSEADGAVQRIPGRGKRVEPIVRDLLTAASWPKFAHPYPLSDKYVLATCKRDAAAPWEICLVDVFDNILSLHRAEGYGLFEPIPLRPTPRPPVLASQVDPARKDAVVYLMDVYRGPGLRGVPRGAVKRLRLYSLHFAYRGRGGLLGTVGVDGPWDVRRILGTVPVEADGSALFRVPANTPVAVQPLDAEGKALQLMRSWFVGMPGERVSCVGCHERQADAPPDLDTLAYRRPPSAIAPWYGPPRGFSYAREVQPVIDRHCVRCHDGSTSLTAGGKEAQPDLRGTKLTADYKSVIAGNSGGVGGRRFTEGYFQLSRHVRRPGIESDIHVLPPLEYHADTTQLVQLLRDGHHGVQLGPETWDRLITWIDLNAPFHGTWGEAGIDPKGQRQRRQELRRRYAGVDEDPEGEAELGPAKLGEEEERQKAKGKGQKAKVKRAEGWPFSEGEAKRRQAAAGPNVRQTVGLGEGVRMRLVLIPSGEFVMGDSERVAQIGEPFWMGVTEVTNEEYARFDPLHDSRFESKNGYQFGVEGFPLDGPKQPVVRVSWERAMAFCRWLSERTGQRFGLPTGIQWEWACRAGTATAFPFGRFEADYSRHANVADRKLREFASDPYKVFGPLRNATRYDDWIPRDDRFDDGGLVTVDVGRYQPNAWGLHDMHGNVWEWTATADDRAGSRRVVRGGSWRDRPTRCRSASRLSYPPWQGVYNVGFRVVCPAR